MKKKVKNIEVMVNLIFKVIQYRYFNPQGSHFKMELPMDLNMPIKKFSR